MACGTPVVTSNTSSLPEVVGDAAVLVDPTDARAIAEGLAHVLADPQPARRPAAAGRRPRPVVLVGRGGRGRCARIYGDVLEAGR